MVLEVARSWGVSPSVFLGRTLTTTYVYDGADRIVASDTASAWTQEDRELAVAYGAWEADRCPGCNGQLTETTDPANEEMYDAGVQARCHRCTAIDIAQDAAQHAPRPTALLLGARLRTETQGDHETGIHPE
jgi:hypothetical protein